MLTNFLPRAAMAVALAATAVAGVQSYRLQVERTAHAETKATVAVQRQDYYRESAKAVQAARDEEQRRTTAVQEIANDTQTKLDAARADAGRANAAAAGLRKQLAVFTAAHRSEAAPGAATSSPGPAAGAALDLLADMFQRNTDALIEIGEYADRARIAGEACEKVYDSLGAK